MLILSIFLNRISSEYFPRKNVFKLDAEFEIFKSAAHFSVYFDFMRCLRHENGNLKKNALSKIESLCHADYKHFLK
jgi:hypothetical protein